MGTKPLRENGVALIAKRTVRPLLRMMTTMTSTWSSAGLAKRVVSCFAVTAASTATISAVLILHWTRCLSTAGHVQGAPVSLLKAKLRRFSPGDGKGWKTRKRRRRSRRERIWKRLRDEEEREFRRTHSASS